MLPASADWKYLDFSSFRLVGNWSVSVCLLHYFVTISLDVQFGIYFLNFQDKIEGHCAGSSLSLSLPFCIRGCSQKLHIRWVCPFLNDKHCKWTKKIFPNWFHTTSNKKFIGKGSNFTGNVPLYEDYFNWRYFRERKNLLQCSVCKNAVQCCKNMCVSVHGLMHAKCASCGVNGLWLLADNSAYKHPHSLPLQTMWDGWWSTKISAQLWAFNTTSLSLRPH